MYIVVCYINYVGYEIEVCMYILHIVILAQLATGEIQPQFIDTVVPDYETCLDVGDAYVSAAKNLNGQAMYQCVNEIELGK